jgi:hypothetical protein
MKHVPYRDYHIVDLPIVDLYLSSNELLKETFNKTFLKRNKDFTLSNFFNFKKKLFTANVDTERHNKNWKLFGDRYRLVRHQIIIKDDLKVLDDKEAIIAELLDFLRSSGRTIRDLYIKVPNEVDSTSRTYEIHFPKPYFLYYTREHSLYQFSLVVTYEQIKHIHMFKSLEAMENNEQIYLEIPLQYFYKVILNK